MPSGPGAPPAAPEAPFSPDDFAAALAPLRPRRPLVLAVSGGSDSMALLHLAADWARGQSADLLVASVDHGLRPEAKEECAQVAEACRTRGLAHRLLRWNGSTGANLQARARAARYRLLGGLARDLGGDLLTAHTRDDQAETFLLRLQRGSGLDGLAAMAHAADLGGGARLLRPLLGASRAQLQAFLRSRGVPWCEDPSNADDRFARVRMRSLLETLSGEGLDAARLAETAGHLARARAALERYVDALDGAALRLDPAGFAELALAPLLAAPRETALRLLSRTLQGVGGREYGPRFERLERLLARLETEGPFMGATLHRCRLIGLGAPGERVLVVRESRALPVLNLAPGSEGVWDRRHRVRLAAGAPPGLRVAALGRAGLGQARGFRAAGGHETGLPPRAQTSLPGLWQDDRLLAAPHLGAFAPGWGQEAFTARFLGLAPRGPAFED